MISASQAPELQTSSTPDLLPLSIGDVFDVAFDLYKRNFALFAGVSAVILVPTSIAKSAVLMAMGFDRLNLNRSSSDSDVTQVLGLGAAMVCIGVVYFLLIVVQSGVLSVAVSEAYLGRRTTVGEAYRRAVPAIPRLIVTWICIGLVVGLLCTMVFGASVLMVGIALAGGAMKGNPSEGAAIAMTIIALFFPTVLGLLGGVALGVFTPQVIVLENGRYFSAVARNLDMLRDRFVPILIACVLLILIGFALQMALFYSVIWLLELFVYPWIHFPSLWQKVVQAVWGALLSLALHPFYITCLTLMYYDQRVRREGFDLALMERRLNAARTVEG